MTTSLIIVAAPGLVAADLGLRVYDAAGAPLGAALSVLELEPGQYRVTNLPSPESGSYTLTWSAGTGGGARVYPPLRRPPNAVVMAVRGTVAAGDAAPVLYRDQQVYPAALAVDEVGDVGDLRVTGIPVDLGEWELVVATPHGQLLAAWPGAHPPTATSTAIPVVERELVMTYLTTRWTRSHLATVLAAPAVPDPGHGEDAVSPVLWYGQPFDPSREADVAALSSYAVRELRGYGLFIVTPATGTWAGLELPLSLVGDDWLLETPGGSVVATTDDAVATGETVTFDTGSEAFAGEVAASYLHGVGFVVVNLVELQAEALDLGSRGSVEARLVLRLLVAAAPPSAPAVPETYAAALAALFRGVMWVSDPTAAPETLERRMADAGILIVRQYARRDPVQERPTRLGDDSGWAWYNQEVPLRRQARAPSIGRQAPTP
jgi:hypothetical protein